MAAPAPVLTMSHLCCERCRLRFTPEEATYLLACPECGKPTAWVQEPQRVFGFRLFDPMDLSDMVTYGCNASPGKRGPT